MEWYEELDYEESPFKDTEETELIGYEEVLDEVLYRLSSGSIVCVEGKSGAGKTAILRSAMHKFNTGRVVYLNGSRLDGLNIEKVLKKKASLMKRVFNKKPRNMILLLDEVQNLSKKNCERIKYYFDNNFIKSAVFTSSDFNKANFTESLKERISKVIKMRELTEDEAVDIVQSRLGNDELMPEDIIKEIFNKSKRNMKLFLENCDKLCQFAIENNGKQVLPEHMQEIFEESGEELDVEEPEAVNKKITKKNPCKKSNSKVKSKEKCSRKKESNPEDPRLVVEEPVKVTISDDFAPEKKEVKMEDGVKEEEIDIDDELKKLRKANKLEDDETETYEDYEEDYEEFKESDEEEDEVKKDEGEDIAEKYY